MGLWGFRTEQKDKLKKHSGAICLIKQRGERERERERESEARKIKKDDREEKGERNVPDKRESLSCLSLLL